MSGRDGRALLRRANRDTGSGGNDAGGTGVSEKTGYGR